MMSIAAIAVFAAALFLTALAPGSMVMTMTSRVIARGWRDVLPFIIAMWFGELVWLSAALGGLSVLAATFQEVFTVLKYLGVCYLLWLAWRTWQAQPTENTVDIPKRGSAFGMFVGGLIISLSGPEIMVFYLALLPSLVDLQAVTVQLWLTLVAVALFVIMLADAFWITVAMFGRKMLKTQRAMRIMGRISAGAIATAAGVVATR